MKEDQIEAKLDQILDILSDLTKRVDRLEMTLTSSQKQMQELDSNLSKSCDSIELILLNKTENDKFTDLSQKVENLEKEKASDRDLIDSQQKEITRLTELNYFKAICSV